MPTVHRYRRHWLWPVLDDDGKLEYWDVHAPEDGRGEGEPLEQGFSTMTAAKQWVDERIRLVGWIDFIDGIFDGIRR